MNNDLPDSDSPFHARLRAATKQPHHALDHHPLLAALIHAPSRQDYAAALAGLHGVYAAAEQAIFEFLATRPGLFDYAARRKLPALEADLSSLGRPPLLAAETLPPPTNVGTLVGMLYTIEGSTRGGRFIFRHLQQHFDETAPLRFFAGYGEASELRWQEFWQFADSACPAAEHADAIASAVQMFSFIKTHLDRCHTQRP